MPNKASDTVGRLVMSLMVLGAGFYGVTQVSSEDAPIVGVLTILVAFKVGFGGLDDGKN